MKAIRKAFPFNVEMRALFGPNGESTDFFGLFRDDTDQCVSRHACKASYRPHTVEEVELITKAATQGLQTDKMQCHWTGSAHVVLLQPSNQQRRSIQGAADNIFPRFMLRAGYDGRKFRATLGWWRDLCDNLVMLESVSECTMAITHTANLSQRIDELSESFHALASHWSEVTNMAKQMQGRSVTLEDFEKQVFGTTRGDNAFADKRHNALQARIDRERKSTKRRGKLTLWEAFNAVQGYAQHDRTRTANVSAMDRAMLAQADPDARRALEIALKLAA